MGQIVRTRLKDQVADRLLDMIVSGGLEPGRRLPPERELVESLGVSRTVVREALHLLEARGVIRIEHGRGAVVDDVNGRAVRDAIGFLFRAEPESLWDLLEMRKVLEVEIAGFAAARATGQDLEAMRGALGRMEEKIDAPEGYVDADVEFHGLLARSARNRVLLTMIEPITDLLLASRELTGSRPSNARRALEAHEAILRRVEAGDDGGARQAMRDHLATTERDIREALSKEESS